MRIFLAGAAGAIGSRLLPMLVSAGHTVTGTTRSWDRAEAIGAAGGTAAVLNALDAGEVLEAVQRAEPDVIIHQLTAIPARFDLRRFDHTFAATNRLRTEGTDNLLRAARAVGCRRFIAQSYAGWPYARTGGWIKTEEDPLLDSPEPGLRSSLDAIRRLESAVTEEPAIEGFVMRYGSFYGPGTSLGSGGSLLQDIQRSWVAIVGTGAGRWSFVHIDDAASATLAAVGAAVPGVYNVADDEPAPVSEWLPYLAGVLGAKPPRRIPRWLGNLASSQHGVVMITGQR